MKTRRSETFVIAGYVFGEGSRARLGSLVLAAEEDDGALRYVGNVGTGFTEPELDRLLGLLEPLWREQSALAAVPRDPRLRRGRVAWVEPVLRAEVEFTEWTHDGHVRAPVYKGLRDDAERAPRARELRSGRRALRLTRLDQRWFPELGLLKEDVVDYYLAVAPVLLPHLRGRPFTMKRYPNGPRGPCFWLKDAPESMPSWIPTCPLPARSRGGGRVAYPVLDHELALAWMVDFGCVDLHVWLSRCDLPSRPEYVLFDLDPAAGARFSDVVRAALLVRDALAALGLESHARTTGGDGLHVQVPIARRYGFEQTRELAAVVAGALVRTEPELVTTSASPARRRGVFVDVKMNGEGMTIVAPYSVRPRTGAVATPLRWEELDERLDPLQFTPEAVVARVQREGDLAEPLLRGRQRLERALRV